MPLLLIMYSTMLCILVSTMLYITKTRYFAVKIHFLLEVFMKLPKARRIQNQTRSVTDKTIGVGQ